MKFLFVLFSFVSTFAFALGMPGGWSKADPTSDQIIQEAAFAVQQKYPNIAATFTVVSAMQQVVAGMKYDLTVDVRIPNQVCQVNHFQVWDRFGAKTLAESETLSGSSCTSSA